MKTASDGKFSFEKLDPGDYVIQVEADHLLTLHSSITVVGPRGGKCKRALEVVLGLGMDCDTYLVVVNTKDVR